MKENRVNLAGNPGQPGAFSVFFQVHVSIGLYRYMCVCHLMSTESAFLLFPLLPALLASISL